MHDVVGATRRLRISGFRPPPFATLGGTPSLGRLRVKQHVVCREEHAVGQEASLGRCAWVVECRVRLSSKELVERSLQIVEPDPGDAQEDVQ